MQKNIKLPTAYLPTAYSLTAYFTHPGIKI